jgi:hypothetical protein
MTTPPGWYPDQGQTGNGPGIERWWDGNAWTEYTRTADQPPVPPVGPYGQPAMPGFPPQPPPGNRKGAVIAAVVGGVLLVGAVAAGAAVLHNGDGGGKATAAKPAPTGSSSAPSAPPSTPAPGSGEPSTAPPADPSDAAVDHSAGISLPLLDGWEKRDTKDTGNAYISTAPFTCDTTPSKSCVSAGVYTVPGAGADAKHAAEADIAANAKSAYGEIKSHKETKAGKVTVAGQPGYLVRWKLDVAKGPDGTVQSVSFKSPTTGALTTIRFGFDATGKAPELSVMDEILKGVKTVGPTNGV